MTQLGTGCGITLDLNNWPLFDDFSNGTIFENRNRTNSLNKRESLRKTKFYAYHSLPIKRKSNALYDEEITTTKESLKSINPKDLKMCFQQ